MAEPGERGRLARPPPSGYGVTRAVGWKASWARGFFWPRRGTGEGVAPGHSGRLQRVRYQLSPRLIAFPALSLGPAGAPGRCGRLVISGWARKGLAAGRAAKLELAGCWCWRMAVAPQREHGRAGGRWGWAGGARLAGRGSVTVAGHWPEGAAERAGRRALGAWRAIWQFPWSDRRVGVGRQAQAQKNQYHGRRPRRGPVCSALARSLPALARAARAAQPP